MKQPTEDLLQIRSHEGSGFAPLLRFGSWRVAMTNAARDERTGAFQRHLKTDECFVMLSGEGCMLVAGGEERPGEICRADMERGKVYNVRRGVWHAHMMRAGSSLLIVENDDTGEANSDTYVLDAGEQEALNRLLGADL